MMHQQAQGPNLELPSASYENGQDKPGCKDPATSGKNPAYIVQTFDNVTEIARQGETVAAIYSLTWLEPRQGDTGSSPVRLTNFKSIIYENF